MIPFRVYDRENKITWTIINYHDKPTGGTYLAARGDDSEEDRVLSELTIEELLKHRMVDFLDEGD
ncbi:MAG: hypothetical protein R3B45_08555 [Bdellovibrionota bacterium]